jgi:ribonuclease Y
MGENLIISALFAFAAGFGIAWWVKTSIIENNLNAAKQEAQRIVAEAKQKAENLQKEAQIEAKDRLFKMKSEFDAETHEMRSELRQQEKRLIQKEENLEKKEKLIEERDTKLASFSKELEKREKKSSEEELRLGKLIAEQQSQLEKISGLTKEEAKAILLKEMEQDARYEGAKLVKRITSEAQEQAEKEARKIIATAIQRYSGDYVAERTVSVVELPNDDMKGRIIGREGRNIRALEAATGIDLIIDDTPEAVILSGFNPVRREVARIALTKLIADGRIHPARIEEIVVSVEEEVDKTIKEAGEQAAFDLGVHGIDPELIMIVGRLKFRTSYAQNMLQHSIEVGFLCGIMAAELGLDVKLARRMGLLHDIGKAIDHEVEGPHALIGAKIAAKHGESEAVVQAIAAHHEDVVPETVYDLLVQSADSLSGARPGARKELLENYVKRLEDLENIACGFNGVSGSYAIQAGRELRVIVESAKISDDEAVVLSQDIAKAVEEQLTFPGQIKVTVIRELRAVGYANK